MSQNRTPERCCYVNACRDATVDVCDDLSLGLEGMFRAEYKGIARAIAAITKDPGRSEELAVEVFLKWSQTPSAQGQNARGWLYRTAIRVGLDDLRRQKRRQRYWGMFRFMGLQPSPDELLSLKQDGQRVQSILAGMAPREAELLLLRSQGFDYRELAVALRLNSASVGTLLSRANKAFRKAYVNRYGEH